MKNMTVMRRWSLTILTLSAAFLLAGCMSGRKVSYSPLVSQRLSHLKYLAGEMVRAAANEYPSISADPSLPENAGARPRILTAITKGIVQEVEDSVGGFYDPQTKVYEGVYAGGANRGERSLDPVEQAQLEPLVEQAALTIRYQESTAAFYEQEVAQVASPLVVGDRVVLVAWIRTRLPTSIKNVTERQNKFSGAATSRSGSGD